LRVVERLKWAEYIFRCASWTDDKEYPWDLTDEEVLSLRAGVLSELGHPDFIAADGPGEYRLKKCWDCDKMAYVEHVSGSGECQFCGLSKEVPVKKKKKK